jgi:transcriptional regulator with XRE-family HTH domain
MIGFMLVLKPKHLTGKEAKFLRKHLGYTAEDFSKVIGVGRVAVTKWETEATKLKGSNDKHIRRIYLAKKEGEIGKTPSIMKIVNTLIDFINLDNGSAATEFKIRSEDWSACTSA